MKHTPDQDLLLMAHHSLDPIRTLGARFHVWRCKACRARYAEFGSLSSNVASAVRVGLPLWKPAVTALVVKTAVVALVIGGGLYGAKAVLTPAPTAITPRGEACIDTPGQVKGQVHKSEPFPRNMHEAK